MLYQQASYTFLRDMQKHSNTDDYGLRFIEIR